MLRKMMVVLGLLVLLLPASAALAGNWVVITVDELPGAIRAGETTEISFVVRSHGRTPTHDVEPLLTARNEAGGERLEVAARPAAEPGRFTAAVTFPGAGQWSWSISVEPYPQRVTLAPLTVLPALTGPAPAASPAFDLQPVLRWTGLALLAAAAGLALLGRRQAGRAVAVGD